jgi:excisionase family DNA binding protein
VRAVAAHSVAQLMTHGGLTVEEAAKLLGVSRGSAYEAASRGELPTVRIGRRLLVPRAALLNMLSDRIDELEERVDGLPQSEDVSNLDERLSTAENRVSRTGDRLGQQATRIFPTIWSQRWSVLRVSCHSASGRSGQTVWRGCVDAVAEGVIPELSPANLPRQAGDAAVVRLPRNA